MENHDRRKFLKVGAVLSGSLLLSPSLGLAQTQTAVADKKKNKIAIKQRTLGTGNHSIEVSALGLGCMGMSWNRSFIPERKPMVDVIRKAYDMGVNFFDTAEAYGAFTNEELVGEAIVPFRDKITLCSKFGFDIKNGKLTGGLNSQPKHIREVVEQSLKRLKTDRIDLLYQHRVDPNVPIEDVAGTVKDLIKEGKILNFGLSEADAPTIRKAHEIQQLTAIQTEYSLLSRDPEKDIFPVCEELGIGFVPYSPLCRAYLTGYINERTKYTVGNDNRGSLPRYAPEAVIANWPMIDVLAEFGNKRGLTAAQVALAWLLAQKPWIVPIPGTTKQAHLQENLWAANYEFTAEELKQLTQSVSEIKITGKRY
ncbi:aldo/keto reductase [Flavobacterium sp. LT1R49]|uniref:aldo/keto reductase n=1 Tax=Flavobacterium arabinosi TaxID=3398737 RepID=UPI003A873F4B